MQMQHLNSRNRKNAAVAGAPEYGGEEQWKLGAHILFSVYILLIYVSIIYIFI